MADCLRSRRVAIRRAAAEEPHQAAGSWVHVTAARFGFATSATHREPSGRDRWTKHGNRTLRPLIGRLALSRSRQRMHRIREVSTCRIWRRHQTQASSNARIEGQPPPSFSPSAARWTKSLLGALSGRVLISCLSPTFYSRSPPCLSHLSLPFSILFVCIAV